MNSDKRPGPKRVVQDPVIKTVQMERETLQNLTTLAKTEKCSVSALIRTILSNYIQSH